MGIISRTKASYDQLQARLGRRRSSAARPHQNKAKAEKLPGRGNRRRQNRQAIREQL